MFSTVSAALIIIVALVGLPIWAQTTTQPSPSASATTNPSSDAALPGWQPIDQTGQTAARNTNASAATPAQSGSGNSAQSNRPADNSAPSPAAIAQRLRQVTPDGRASADPRLQSSMPKA